MSRVPRLTRRFHDSRARADVAPGSPAARALAATIAALARAEGLPGPDDYETIIPPTDEAFVRRVPSHNLWILYRFDASEVRLVGIVKHPPNVRN